MAKRDHIPIYIDRNISLAAIMVMANSLDCELKPDGCGQLILTPRKAARGRTSNRDLVTGLHNRLPAQALTDDRVIPFPRKHKPGAGR